jgi:phage-related protein
MKHTKNLYTYRVNTANLHLVSKSENKLAEIEWEPGTHQTLCGFPDGPKGNLGYYLYLVQKGEVPPDSSPVPGIQNVFELRDEDERAWYRVIYLKKIDDKIHVIHCFEKQSNRIEKRDIRTIQDRLGRLNKRLAEEKRNVKKQAREAPNTRKRSR